MHFSNSDTSVCSDAATKAANAPTSIASGTSTARAPKRLVNWRSIRKTVHRRNCNKNSFIPRSSQSKKNGTEQSDVPSHSQSFAYIPIGSVKFQTVHGGIKDVAHADHIFARLESSGVFRFSSFEFCFGEVIGDSLDGETDAAFVGIDFDNAGFDFIADFENVFDFVNAVVAELGDVDETVDLVAQFDESAESGDLGDAALDDITDFVLFGDIAPGIVFGLLEAEGDALLFRIDFEDDNFNFLTGFEQFVGVVDLAGPGHIGNVDHTVDIIFDFDESAVVGHIADLTDDVLAGGILFNKNMDKVLYELGVIEGEARMAEALGVKTKAVSRRARFKSVITLIIDGQVKMFEGALEGVIAREKSGNGGFGYDPIFIADEYPGLTLADISEEQKNDISHRGKALRAMAQWLQNNK